MHSAPSIYRYGCSAGLVGYPSMVNHQRSPRCSGKCPAGYQCDAQTYAPAACGPGTYCQRGSTQAKMCPGGTYSSVWRLKSIRGCHRVGPGFYAPRGSPSPIPCPIAGYRCPGARSAALGEDSGEGSAPLQLTSGAVSSMNLP